VTDPVKGPAKGTAEGRIATPRLSRLARAAASAGTDAAPPPIDPEGRCELCSEPLPERHRHLLDLETTRLLCACQACSLLMDHQAAGGGHYRLIPDEAREIVDLELPDPLWNALGVPVELAFLVHSTPREGVTAFYPGAMGATEARPDPDAWAEVVAGNPVLADLVPDVEALLVRRVDAERRGWIAPIDACFRLTGQIRTRWRGLAGGSEVFAAIQDFFEGLSRTARAVDRRGRPAEASARGAAAAPHTSQEAMQ